MQSTTLIFFHLNLNAPRNQLSETLQKIKLFTPLCSLLRHTKCARAHRHQGSYARRLHSLCFTINLSTHKVLQKIQLFTACFARYAKDVHGHIAINVRWSRKECGRRSLLQRTKDACEPLVRAHKATQLLTFTYRPLVGLSDPFCHSDSFGSLRSLGSLRSHLGRSVHLLIAHPTPCAILERPGTSEFQGLDGKYIGFGKPRHR